MEHLLGKQPLDFMSKLFFVGKPRAEDHLWNWCQNWIDQPNDYNQEQDKLLLSVGSDGIFIFQYVLSGLIKIMPQFLERYWFCFPFVLGDCKLSSNRK